ncbi:LapA family protein [Micromonospora endolithica]|uniref:LapA family protein n=1 Tax=Micromonospora endolithica TaxID=230091 RepID=A0A3A9YY66_9ACTN|nr:LapA family protein [Micromonospora endolithica]RKN41082.1 LapA family protein [Micromonospora endolithica]TWJ24307.1 putative integral membrane protein [Micromonospora endolithica]
MTAPRNNHVRSFPRDGLGDSDAPAPRRTAARRSRIGGVWVAAVVFAVVLLLLLIFVLQNGQRAEVSFLGAHGTLPMGVALLLAAVFGVLLVALPGTARIVQLRMADRRPARRSVDQPGSGPDSRSASGVAGGPLPPRPDRWEG